ncbi:MAG TPA: type II secretion system protein GspM [Candidatus Omnitrophota bacterium]|nr:type II secretion system protein GspM [Candidatus Omnitrophota bacterium]
MNQRLAGRLGAVGVLAALVCVPVFGLMMPVLDHHAGQQERIALLESQLARLKAAAAQREDLKRQQAELAARRGKSGLLLTGGSEALATATLQNMIKTAVARAGGELRSTQALPVTAGQGARRLTVRALLSTDVEGLRTFLHAIEAGRPLLFVDDLDVRARPGGRDDDGDRVALEIRVDVTGYLGGE